MAALQQVAAPRRFPQTHESLAAVAHDLRLPLSHIKGYVSTLRRDDVVWDDETRGEFLADIEQEVDRLAQMIDSLLRSQAARARGGREARVVSTDPAAIVKGALHRTRGLFDGRPLRVTIAQELPSLRADPAELERVLANLLQNAAKYSPAGTPIGISARVTDTDELEFAVEDEGPGVPPEDRERIFEPFFRNQRAAQSSTPGNGLGLAICHSIVLANGGRMAVADRPGGGARFSVFLPPQPHAARVDTQYPAEEKIS
jgi:two-component system sensor histidine kinase KdpD